jgi:DNA-binding NarL/FixJ family response regulator
MPASPTVAAQTPYRIRLLVADDHPLVRDGIVAVVSAEPDMEVVAQAGDGREAVARFRSLQPDVALMDVQMPGLDGIGATAAIRSQAPTARIVILTTYDGDVQAMRALKAGASGYLLKSMFRTEVMDAIRTVHAGRRYVPQAIAARLGAHAMSEELSPREVEVLREVAQGGGNLAVARRLGVSDDTVKTHMKHILSKLEASDRTQAVTIAVRRGIIGL